ncbi:MAG: hypothetical protein WCT99_07075 [Bacteroidota bacterium]
MRFLIPIVQHLSVLRGVLIGREVVIRNGNLCDTMIGIPYGGFFFH